MITRNLVRWSGLAAMVGPILLAVADVMKYYVGPANETNSIWMATGGWSIGAALISVGALLILGGLLGLYSHQAEKAGTLGLIGFLMAFVGTVMLVGLAWHFELLIAPWLAVAAPELADSEPSMRVALGAVIIPGLLYILGWMLFGVASLRAKVFPRLAAALLVVGIVLDPITVAAGIPIVAEAVLGVGMGWMGYIVWTERGEVLAEPAAAT